MNRNFNDPRYIAWRKAVKAKDGWKCLKCGSKRSLQSHHIRKWAEYPTLRYAVSNGITLCWDCHAKLWGAEESWVAYCMLLILQDGKK